MTVISTPSLPPILMLELLTLQLWDLQTQELLLILTGTMSCGVKRRSFRDKSMTLGWPGINGKTRTTQYSTISKQPELAHAYTPTSKGRRIPPVFTITLTQPSLQESPLQMSFMDKSPIPLTASLCLGYMMKRDQASVAG